MNGFRFVFWPITIFLNEDIIGRKGRC